MAKENKKKSNSKSAKQKATGQVSVKENDTSKAKKELSDKGNKKQKKLKKKLFPLFKPTDAAFIKMSIML